MTKETRGETTESTGTHPPVGRVDPSLEAVTSQRQSEKVKKARKEAKEEA